MHESVCVCTFHSRYVTEMLYRKENIKKVARNDDNGFSLMYFENRERKKFHAAT